MSVGLSTQRSIEIQTDRTHQHEEWLMTEPVRHLVYKNFKRDGSKGKGEVVPVLNLAPRHEDFWGSRGIAPRIL
jgi:hypothetical protein